MKKILGTFTNFLIIITLIFSLFMVSNANNNGGVSINSENQINRKLFENENELKLFDTSKFTNTSHWINVSREINANQYAYTTSLTKIRLYNNLAEEINAFNYTIPTHEYKDSKYLEIYSDNGTVDTSPPIEINDSTMLTIKFPSVGYKEFIEIVISMDHPNAVSSDDDAVLDESQFPYHFNLSLIPLISLPITKYDLKWEVEGDIEVSFDNDSIQPTKNDFKGTITIRDYGLDIKNVTELTAVNRSLINTSEYGNYNLTALGNRKFLPAYTSSLSDNLTSYLSFNYFHYGNIRLEFSHLSTTVSVTEWGIITTKHEFTILNNGLKSGKALSTALGGSTFPFITVKVSEEAYNFILTDKYGNVSATKKIDSVEDVRSIEIRPRIQIESGAEYSLSLSYKQKTKDLAKDLGAGKVELEIPLTMKIDWFVHSFEFNLLLPWGSKWDQNMIETIENSTIRTPVKVTQVNNKGLLGIFNMEGPKIAFTSFTPLSNKDIKLIFGISPFYLLQTPLSICILFFLIGFGYTVIRNLSFGFKRKVTSLEEIPLDLIKNFVKDYEEKTAIREQVIRLDRKRKSKNISAREYEKTRSLLNNRQQRADRSIVSVSQKLGEEGPRYRVAMRSIEVAEASRENILQNIESLERKKNQGRIGKEAYAKLKMSYNKQLRKANNEIDKVLIELRSLLTK